MVVADKLRADYDFAHTTDAKLVPRGESLVTGALVRFLKPFDELFVDSKNDLKSTEHGIGYFYCYIIGTIGGLRVGLIS
ncbi:hypothetical protein CsatA_006597 [Cannabis sativa]